MRAERVTKHVYADVAKIRSSGCPQHVAFQLELVAVQRLRQYRGLRQFTRETGLPVGGQPRVGGLEPGAFFLRDKNVSARAAKTQIASIISSNMARERARLFGMGHIPSQKRYPKL